MTAAAFPRPVSNRGTRAASRYALAPASQVCDKPTALTAAAVAVRSTPRVVAGGQPTSGEVGSRTASFAAEVLTSDTVPERIDGRFQRATIATVVAEEVDLEVRRGLVAAVPIALITQGHRAVQPADPILPLRRTILRFNDCLVFHLCTMRLRRYSW